jgi:transposase-like protein
MGQMQEGISDYAAQSISGALDQEVEVLLGREAYERQDIKDETRVEAYCLGCGSQRRRDFRRNGHKERGLGLRHAGYVRVWMPRLECKVCGGTVHVEYKTVRPRQRLWGDVAAEARAAYGWGESLREIKAQLDAQMGSSLSIRWLNGQVQQLFQLVGPYRESTEGLCPLVLLLDAIWVKVMEPTGRMKRDRKGRNRAVKGVKRRPILVALGLWPQEKRKVILDWEVGDQAGEDEESWIRFLTRLEEAGVCGKKGLRLIVHDGGEGLCQALEIVHFAALDQRCIFHKLRNVRDDIVIPEQMEGKEGQALRRKILQEAAQIWQAQQPETARRRLQAFCEQWASSQPQAVETLQRDFEATMSFYEVLAWAKAEGQKWPATWLRTTSPLERINRSYRRKFRSMVIAHSQQGLQAVLYLMTIRIAQAKSPFDPWPSLVERLLAGP